MYLDYIYEENDCDQYWIYWDGPVYEAIWLPYTFTELEALALGWLPEQHL